jgi:hypothetical protein
MLLSSIPSTQLGTAANADQPPARRYLLNNCFIAGFQHHEGPALLAELKVGSQLALVREPENIYDRYAIRLEYDGRHVGYIPREQNRTVSELLAQGAPISCSITAVNPAAPVWESVRIEVSIPVVEPPAR